MTYKYFIASQSCIMIAGSMVFPFYILLLRSVGDSFSQFGWAYGLFALTAALVYPIAGKLADRIGDQKLLVLYAWGMAALMLCFPIATEVWHVYSLQILMGCLSTLQRNTEKTVLVRQLSRENAGYTVGRYHVWTSIAGAIAVIVTGYLIDFLTIGAIFYFASLIYAVSAILLNKKRMINI
ncbi:MFS transporter [Ectobacillus sp. JY-23]|uniref:MFS transporter n=1 Tax=Ectobacillus sp. JY-23 TaxID=2933872 RepID=UPI001FF32FAD|nr:MFS transporter [Ectobacillus sp. JY-23]UOY92999.1 MFS transporter [Ectobacillus sp. JY-23]